MRNVKGRKSKEMKFAIWLKGHLTIKRASFPSIFIFFQLTNQNWHLFRRGNIIFVGIRAVYLYQILFNEIFMSCIAFLYKTLEF